MSFVTPEQCISDVLSLCTRMSHGKYGGLQRLACFSSLIFNFVFRLLEEASESLRLVAGQTLPIAAGFSGCLPCVVFLSWQACSPGGWASLFFHPISPVTPVQGEVAALTAATSVQRSCVCGCVCAGLCEPGRCVQSLQSGQVKGG